MNSAVITPYASLQPRPWKNGRGITRNVFDDANAHDEWTWRISIAEITGEQPYSQYPGIHRDQVALGPGAAQLTIDGAPLTLPVEGVTAFEGEAVVSALPESPGFLDMNVMTRRDSWATAVEVRDLVGELTGVGIAGAAITVLVALGDDCRFGERALERLDAVMWEAGAAADINAGQPREAHGRFVVAELRAR